MSAKRPCAADSGPGANWYSARQGAVILLATLLAGCVGGYDGRTNTWTALARRDAMPLARLAELVAPYRIVLLGEAHALVEPVDTVRMLLSDTERGGWTDVAFEWSVADQADIDRFMSGADTVMEQFRKRYGQLPGATDEYFGVFSFIREGNRRHPDHAVKAWAVDVPHPVRNTAEEERDRHMFGHIVRIISARSDPRVLVYAGAGHTMKSGYLEQTRRDGRKVRLRTLGSQLRQRYAGEVVSIRILSPNDPMWSEIANEGLFQSPVVIPISAQWPDPRRLFTLSGWRADRAYVSNSAHSLYDYAVWWPTSRPGKRGG